ncbi:integral membrane protein [Botrytis cinerea]
MGFLPNRKRQEAIPAQQAGTIAPEGRTTDKSSDRTLTPGDNSHHVSTAGVDIKRATKARKRAIYVTSFLYFVAIIFLILTIIGNINNRAVIRDTWFFRLDLTNIIPESVGGGITLQNSLARSLGLHDFYQVGLWNFCEGYNDEGITACSTPETSTGSIPSISSSMNFSPAQPLLSPPK